MSDFQLFKLEVARLVGLSKDALHVYVGMSVFLLLCFIGGSGRRPWMALAAVAGLAAAGEAWDLLDTYRADELLRWDKSAHDVVNTVFWPTVLTLVLPLRGSARSGLHLLRRRARDPEQL